MKICTVTDNNEVLINTLRDADYIDAVTPSIPTNSIIIDSELPILAKNKALKVKGARNDQGYYLSSVNTEVVDDYRGKKAYSTKDGSEVEIKELGELPKSVTLKPRPSEYHTFDKGEWVITKADAARKKADEDKAHNQQVFAKMDALERKQNRPLREAALASTDTEKKAALTRVKAIDEQIDALRAQLKK